MTWPHLSLQAKGLSIFSAFSSPSPSVSTMILNCAVITSLGLYTSISPCLMVLSSSSPAQFPVLIIQFSRFGYCYFQVIPCWGTGLPWGVPLAPGTFPTVKIVGLQRTTLSSIHDLFFPSYTDSGLVLQPALTNRVQEQQWCVGSRHKTQQLPLLYFWKL